MIQVQYVSSFDMFTCYLYKLQITEVLHYVQSWEYQLPISSSLKIMNQSTSISIWHYWPMIAFSIKSQRWSNLGFTSILHQYRPTKSIRLVFFLSQSSCSERLVYFIHTANEKKKKISFIHCSSFFESTCNTNLLVKFPRFITFHRHVGQIVWHWLHCYILKGHSRLTSVCLCVHIY